MANNSNDILKKTQELLSAKAAEKEVERTRVERERRELITSLSQDIAKIVGPAINNLAQSQEVTFNKMRQLLREIKIEAPKMPEIKIPNINVPQARVQVNVPDVHVPPINIPKADPIRFPESMQVSMDQYDNTRPLPVMMMDTKGKPMSFSMGAGGGGKADFLTIKDIKNSTGGSLITDEGKLKVDASVSVGAVTVSQDYGNGIGDPGETGAETPRMVMATDAIASVNVRDAFGSTAITGMINPDNRLRVSLETGGSGLTDAELRATSVPVSQISDAVWSTYVSGIFGSIAMVTVNPDGTPTYGATEGLTDAELRASDVGVSVSDIFGTVGTNVVNPDGRLKVEMPAGSSGLTDGELRASSVPVSQASDSVYSTNMATALASEIDSISVTQISGAVFSTLSRPVQVRSALTTAYATLSTGTETTLATAVAGKYLDLVYVMGANDSDAAVTVFLRPVTGGNIMMALEIPANSTAGVAPSVPIPSSDTGNNWTADMGDITGTNVYLSGLFSQES